MLLVFRIALFSMAFCLVAGTSQAEYPMAPTGVAGVFGPMSFQPLPSGGTTGKASSSNAKLPGRYYMAPTGRSGSIGLGRSGAGFGLGRSGRGFGTGANGAGFGMGASGTGFGMGRSGGGFGMGPTGTGLGVTSGRHSVMSGMR